MQDVVKEGLADIVERCSARWGLVNTSSTLNFWHHKGVLGVLQFLWKRVGFSIRRSTTRLSCLAHEKQKVQFVCNKEVCGRKVSEEPAIEESDDSNYEVQKAESEPVWIWWYKNAYILKSTYYEPYCCLSRIIFLPNPYLYYCLNQVWVICLTAWSFKLNT